MYLGTLLGHLEAISGHLGAILRLLRAILASGVFWEPLASLDRWLPPPTWSILGGCFGDPNFIFLFWFEGKLWNQDLRNIWFLVGVIMGAILKSKWGQQIGRIFGKALGRSLEPSWQPLWLSCESLGKAGVPKTMTKHYKTQMSNNGSFRYVNFLGLILDAIWVCFRFFLGPKLGGKIMQKKIKIRYAFWLFFEQGLGQLRAVGPKMGPNLEPAPCASQRSR